MQTFLPQPDFQYSATVLDKLRLGKQRVEAAQILSLLLGVKWSTDKGAYVSAGTTSTTHPAVAMWRGHEGSLFKYVVAMCSEWERRGFNDSIGVRIAVQLSPMIPLDETLWAHPEWMRSTDVCSSHRAVLLAKDPVHYSKFGWPEKPAQRNAQGRWPYVWPVATTARQGT